MKLFVKSDCLDTNIEIDLNKLMNPNSPLTIYAMIGAIGSGKTTLARKISVEQNAEFFSLDGTIKSFNVPIKTIYDYELHMEKAREIMTSKAIEWLNKGRSVVFDIGGPWPWLKGMADFTDTKIEIYLFEISSEERWRRVQKRNLEKPEGIYHFTMTKEEFDSQNPMRGAPPLVPGLKVIKITK